MFCLKDKISKLEHLIHIDVFGQWMWIQLMGAKVMFYSKTITHAIKWSNALGILIYFQEVVSYVHIDIFYHITFLQSDHGSEYIGKHFQDFLKEHI